MQVCDYLPAIDACSCPKKPEAGIKTSLSDVRDIKKQFGIEKERDESVLEAQQYFKSCIYKCMHSDECKCMSLPQSVYHKEHSSDMPFKSLSTLILTRLHSI